MIRIIFCKESPFNTLSGIVEDRRRRCVSGGGSGIRGKGHCPGMELKFNFSSRYMRYGYMFDISEGSFEFNSDTVKSTFK